ncbi:MAG: LysM peptidoglycan-binding domain-containing protein, partial [Chloroflexi bacterium]|nr:LysM peptidoglycan-binding domain-containing protein [Chloroflexota bacterium]
LLGIAAKYGSSVKKILDANPGLNADDLPLGKTIAVPVVFTEPKPVAPAAGSNEPVFYIVEEGDTPLAIAQEYDVPVELLLAANEITDPTLLQIGQQLLIPPSEGLTQGVPIILYDLEAGDTLLGLASKFGSSVKDILAVNPNLIPSALEEGETVAIPVIFAPPRPTPAPVQVNRPTPPPMPPPPGLVEMEQQMIAGVNSEREAAGLPPYQVDPEIAQMALDHAQDMVVRGFFGHITPEGVTLRDRFEEIGIANVTNVGEDIQRNTRPAGETVQFALNWFMNSRPHRANILHPHHNRIGVGIVEGPPGWYTYVLVFAYGEILGLTEIPKPAPLTSRGGCWFKGQGVVIHLGVEKNFTPARKAHPAFRVANLAECRRVLEAAGAPIMPDETLPQVRRFYTADPFGNRIEFLQDGDGFKG